MQVYKDKNHDEIVSCLRENGFEVADTSHISRGFPDVIVFSELYATLCEIKSGDGALSLYQVAFGLDASKRGLFYKIIRDTDDVVSWAEGDERGVTISKETLKALIEDLSVIVHLAEKRVYQDSYKPYRNIPSYFDRDVWAYANQLCNEKTNEEIEEVATNERIMYDYMRSNFLDIVSRATNIGIFLPTKTLEEFMRVILKYENAT